MAGRKPASGLSDNHWKVLDMLEKGMSRQEAATAMGWSKDHVDRLCCGNVEKAGGVAAFFKKEYDRIVQSSEAETKALVGENMKLAMKLIREVFTEIEAKKKKTPGDKKLLSMYSNALAKCQPSTQNVKNVSFSYTKGLNAEELVHEFKRLKTIAEQSFDRGGVQGSSEGGTRELPPIDE